MTEQQQAFFLDTWSKAEPCDQVDKGELVYAVLVPTVEEAFVQVINYLGNWEAEDGAVPPFAGLRWAAAGRKWVLY